ncbi:murein L,D-transpeptidase catalytic domain family protein [Chlorobaculum sp. MV4-Y]|uniref:murein L,D-transpeptidase catalytic domain family protein n=1 Tax=Chlorobaculum sp. MV4-Y TaxID=2976335 RepID=UPI0021B0132E|nr:murein L,D-transpeptidase catalytic domain family protein [Chlorobaculum sp. MV4-Y]UWX57985.1 murein L,D-transpeptidase catalytic domain family protein [Chlorobaculum sp. MV4-Y]
MNPVKKASGTAGLLLLLLLLLLNLGTIALLLDSGNVSAEATREAFAAMQEYRRRNPASEPPRTLAVIDYSKPSFMKRMVIIDLKTGRQSFYRVAHGKNSGELFARQFSNTPESNMSSLGLFRIGEQYYGDHGLALRLDGLDSLRNGNASKRDIVLHQAGYVSIPFILLNTLTFQGPRIGRSNGCFVVSKSDISEVVQKLSAGGFIYAWAPGNETP